MVKSMRRACASSSMIARIVLVLLCLAALGTAAAQEVRYIHTDALGSVAVVTDASRNVIERREYEPYGLQLTPTVSGGPGYTGHVQDAATGLTYMQQRYYDPDLGRFLSVDPVSSLQGAQEHFNRYAYAYNNPYRFTDPDGRCPLCFFVPALILYATSGPANAPAPGEPSSSMPAGEQIANAVPGAGRAVTAGKMAANAAGRVPQQNSSEAKPLMGRNPKPSGSRVNTDAGPEGNRATAKSVFRNQAEGQRTTAPMSNGGTRTRAENGVQIRHNPDGSSRVDMPNRGAAPNGESLHTPPPPPPPPPPPRVR